jgi:hypothetical protein
LQSLEDVESYAEIVRRPVGVGGGDGWDAVPPVSLWTSTVPLGPDRLPQALADPAPAPQIVRSELLVPLVLVVIQIQLRGGEVAVRSSNPSRTTPPV